MKATEMETLNSITSFYNPNGSYTKEIRLISKAKTMEDLRSYNARAVYTEPLWKRSLLEFSLGKSNSKSTSEKTTYDYNNLNGKYDKLNDAQTNDYENTYGYTNAGIRVRTQKKKYNYSFGLTWQQAELEGKDH